MSVDRSDRQYPARPLVGVGCVVLNGAHVLLERRGQPPARGAWSIPGGLIELGETVEEAVRREVLEECNVVVEVGPLLGVFEPMVRDTDGRLQYHYVVIDFAGYYVSGELTAGDDAAELCWADPAALDSYELMPVTRQMIERALLLTGGKPDAHQP